MQDKNRFGIIRVRRALRRRTNISKSFSTAKLLPKQSAPFAFWKRVIRRFIIFRPKMCGWSFMSSNTGASFCEWKGRARYYDLTVGEKNVENAAWFYRNPTKRFAEIKDYIAFYPSKMDACYVNDELVNAQKGDFYGGWVTKDIVGPFKGGAGTWGW